MYPIVEDIKPCHSMEDVRTEVDRIDRELITLLAERQGYVEQAGHIKAERTAVRDDSRIEDVISKVRQTATEVGLDPSLAENVWREMIERFIALEFDVFDRR